MVDPKNSRYDWDVVTQLVGCPFGSIKGSLIALVKTIGFNIAWLCSGLYT